MRPPSIDEAILCRCADSDALRAHRARRLAATTRVRLLLERPARCARSSEAATDSAWVAAVKHLSVALDGNSCAG
jgi:hypothetical protein